MQESPILSVITASHLNPHGLKRLHRAIAALDSRVEWIIKDSGACDISESWARGLESSEPRVEFIHTADSGIYDALNTALLAARGRHYLVVGSDDVIWPEPMAALLDALQSPLMNAAQLIALPVMVDSKLRRRSSWQPIWVSAGKMVASHSVGAVIERNLHDTLGPYDLRFRILADSHLLARAYYAGVRPLDYVGAPIGEFGTSGVSSREHASRIVEAFLYNIDLGHNRFIQAALAGMRLSKYFRQRPAP